MYFLQPIDFTNIITEHVHGQWRNKKRYYIEVHSEPRHIVYLHNSWIDRAGKKFLIRDVRCTMLPTFCFRTGRHFLRDSCCKANRPRTPATLVLCNILWRSNSFFFFSLSSVSLLNTFLHLAEDVSYNIPTWPNAAWNLQTFSKGCLPSSLYI